MFELTQSLSVIHERNYQENVYDEIFPVLWKRMKFRSHYETQRKVDENGYSVFLARIHMMIPLFFEFDVLQLFGIPQWAYINNTDHFVLSEVNNRTPVSFTEMEEEGRIQISSIVLLSHSMRR